MRPARSVLPYGVAYAYVVLVCGLSDVSGLCGACVMVMRCLSTSVVLTVCGAVRTGGLLKV